MLSACPASGPDLPALEEVPSPDLSGFSQATREQLDAQRLELDRLLAVNAAPEELADAFAHVGRLYLVYDLTDSAASSLRNALRLERDSVDLHYYLGLLAEEAGNFSDAAASLDAFLEARPHDAAALTRRARVALNRNELKLAQRYFEQAAAVDPDSAAALAGLGQVALARRDYNGAIRTLEQALSLQPEATALRQPLGLAYRGRGDLNRARSLLESVTQRDVVLRDPLLDSLGEMARGAAFFFSQGNLKKLRGDLKGALAAYRRAVELESDNVTYVYTTGGLYGEMGEDEDAIAQFRRALELDPRHRDARFNLATALTKTGDLATASQEFQAVLAIDPEDHEARLRHALVLSASGEASEAREELERIVAFEANNLRGWTELTRLNLGERGLSGARATLARASPHLTTLQQESLLLSLGQALQRLGRHEEAVGVLEQIWEANRANWQAGFALAGSLAHGGRLETAASLYSEAAGLAPEQAGPWLGLASVLRLQERHTEALAALEEGLAVHRAEALRLVLIEYLANCPESACRDTDRALEMAEALYREGPSLRRAEAMAFALASAGRHEDAARLQRQLLDEAVTRGAPVPVVERLQAGLERYSAADSKP